jgi:hypothetical protein
MSTLWLEASYTASNAGPAQRGSTCGGDENTG